MGVTIIGPNSTGSITGSHTESDVVSVGANATVTGDAFVGNFDDTIILSDGSQIGGQIWLGNGADSVSIGENVLVEGQIWSNGAAPSLTLGQGSTVEGDINFGVAPGAEIIAGGASSVTEIDGGIQVAGSVSLQNVEVRNAINFGADAHSGAYTDDTLILDNVTVGDSIRMYNGDDFLSVSDGSQIGGQIWLGNGADTVSIGENVLVEGQIWSNGAAPSLTLGQGSTVEGDINFGAAPGAEIIAGGASSVAEIDGGIQLSGAMSLQNVDVRNGINFGGGSGSSTYTNDSLTLQDVSVGNGVFMSNGDDVVAVSGRVDIGSGTIDGAGNIDTLLLKNGAIISSDVGPIIGDFTVGVTDIAIIQAALTGDNTWQVTLNSGDTFSANNFEAIGTFVCFTSGTKIETSEGDVPVEDLAPGDLVSTYDNGFQEVRWIKAKRFNRAQILANPNLAPVRIRKGALGAGLPERDLLVSQQHRMFVSNRIAERVLGTREALIGAKQLVAIDGIDIMHDVESVEYVHFLCDQHELVYAEGTLSETLFTGPQALKSLPQESIEEIFTLFPELAEHARTGVMPTPVRPFAKAKMARRMAQRLQKNGGKVLEFNA